MPSRDELQPGGRLAAERLGSLGLAPHATGWVPDQPGAVASALDAQPEAPPLDDRAAAPAVGEALRAAIAARLPLWAAVRLERASPATIGLVLAAVVLLGIVGVAHLRHHPAAGSGSYASTSSYGGGTATGSAGPSDPSAAAGAAAATDATSIVVDVGGRVRKPGLVTLPLGARVADAIDAAGGPLRRRELDRIDLAQRVSDGQFLLVGVTPAAGDPAAAAGSVTGSDGSTPVSLSTATIEALETLPGVGPVTAQKIIDWRTAHGGFSSVEQLKQVAGIGPAHYAEISPLVTP